MNTKQKLESIFFVAGEPMSVERLAKLLKAKPEAITSSLRELHDEYRERGIHLLEANNEWQFVTAPESSEVIEALIKSEFSEELSRAAVETLATIAYKGPLTRARIDYMRGVNSSFTIRNVLLRGLIERVENPKDARSPLYRITTDFLKYLGADSREALPEWERLSKTEIIDEP